VKQAPGIRYYEAKMMGAAIATGEIIIYCDSDCVYVSSWLRNILSTFSQNPDIHIVAGETSTPVRNIYELAIALHYFFPRFTNQENVYESDFYFLNNVAFRRDFLLNHPIPTGLPLYRGNCTLHAYTLSHVQSSKIWKHPQSKSTHEPPTSSFSFWRYLLMGRDFVLREHIKSQLAEQSGSSGYLVISQAYVTSGKGFSPYGENKVYPEIQFQPQTQKNQQSDRTDHSQFPMALSLTPYQKLRSTLSAILRFRPFQRGKIIPVLQDQPSQLLLIPFAMPIMLWFELLYTVGKIITYWQPDWILKRYSQVEGELN
jgi:hypothetical protein